MLRRKCLVLSLWGLAPVCLLATGSYFANVKLAAEEPAKPAAEAKEVKEGKEVKEPAPAAPVVKVAASRVSAVTVYPNSALVTREVEVPAGAGTHELIVNPLPPTTINSSLYAEATEGLRVLTTRFRTRPIMQDVREDVRKLQDELKTLEQSKEKLDEDIKANLANSQLLIKLENFTNVTTIQSAEKGLLNAEAAIALTKHITQTRAEQAKISVGLQQQLRANAEQTEFARRKIADLAGVPTRIERDAVIVVEKANAAAGKVRLNYLVDAASWAPQYKLRAGKAAKDQVQLEYLASLVQQTGEDWSSVDLTLSTAKPMLNAAPPELQPLKVAVIPKGTAPAAVPQPDAVELEEQVKNLRSKAQKDFNERKQLSGAGLVNTAAAIDQSWELLNPEAAMQRGCSLASREGPSVTFHLNTRLSVPSRNDEQVLEVTRIDMPPEYYYKAVPLLSSHVYRLADLTNRSNYILLPGDATMYIGTDFVGQMSLPLVAIGESFTAGFGVDPQLQVQRQLVDKLRTTQGGNQALKYDFRILVSSYKAERVKLQVWDRLPHAESDAVGVNLVKVSPEISTDALYLREQWPNNLLRWDVTVDPNMAGEKALAINYELKLELDRQMTISSFQTAGVAGGAHSGHAELAPVTAADAAKIQAALAKLSPEDRPLAEAQVLCAVDQDSRLGSMGPIVKVMVKNTPVFLCCKGCEAEAKAHPDETITQVQKLLVRMANRR